MAYFFTKLFTLSSFFRAIALRDLRFNKVPNINPESVGRQSRPTDSEKSELVFYFSASPLALRPKRSEVRRTSNLLDLLFRLN